MPAFTKRRIGTFDLGVRSVTPYATAGSGGAFSAVDSHIDVGVAADWQAAASALLHEAFEMCCADSGFRYAVSPNYSGDNGCWLFVMTHPQMAEVIGRVGCFATETLPALSRAYRAYHSKPKKR